MVNPIILVIAFVVTVPVSSAQSNGSSPLPIVMWHGMGDTCCRMGSLQKLIDLIKKELPSVYIHSLRIGDDFQSDFENTYFMGVNKQVKLACELIRNDTKLSGGFNLLGFSQGGQFARAVVQRCSLPVKNLITFGGQHQGIYGLPHCPGYSEICDILRRLLDTQAYNHVVQSNFVQAQYWHDPIHEDVYKRQSAFIAEINNEAGYAYEPIYRKNIRNLTNFVMVMFSEDSMVVPRESSHFGFYTPGQAKNITSLEDSEIYTSDLLGLRELDRSGRLIKMTKPGDHLHIVDSWFIKDIIQGYLA